MQRIAPLVVSLAWLPENLFLKAKPPAHFSVLHSRGWRNPFQVASGSRMIGATLHDDYSLVSQ